MSLICMRVLMISGGFIPHFSLLVLLFIINKPHKKQKNHEKRIIQSFGKQSS